MTLGMSQHCNNQVQVLLCMPLVHARIYERGLVA